MPSALNIAINVQSEGAISGVQKLSVQFKGLGDVVRNIRNISLVNMVQGIQDFSQGLKEVVQPGTDFQQGLADLEAITGTTGKDLQELGKYAREVGKSSGLGASQAVEAFKLLASNIDVTTIGGVEGLKKLQQATITLSQAAGTDLAMAANTMAGAINQFKLPAQDAARVINVLGAGAKYGAAEIPDLAESLKNAGAVAAGAGVSIESTVGALEILSQNMIKGAEAGTGLRNVILRLQTKDIPGVDLTTQGLSGSLLALQGRLNDTEYLAKVFGIENIAVAQTLIRNASEVENMTRKVTGTNVAFEQAALRTKTFQHSMEVIRARMDDFKISIFNATGSFLPFTAVIGESIASFSRLVPALWYLQQGAVATVSHMGGLIKKMRESKTAMQALSLAFKSSPIGWVITGVTLLTAGFLILRNRMNELSASQQALNSIEMKAATYMASERIEATKLFDALKKTTPASDERRKVIDQINDRYPGLLKNMNLEKAGAQGIADAYAEIVKQIDRKAKADAAQELLKEKYQSILEQEQVLKAARQKAQTEKIVSGMKVTPAVRAKYVDDATQKEQKELTRRKSEYDAIHFEVMKQEISNNTTVSATGQNQNKDDKRLPLNPSGEIEKAGASIKGDSEAIKNFNININAPFIGENNNIVNNGPGDFDNLKSKLKGILMDILNDMNYAVK